MSQEACESFIQKQLGVGIVKLGNETYIYPPLGDLSMSDFSVSYNATKGTCTATANKDLVQCPGPGIRRDEYLRFCDKTFQKDSQITYQLDQK